MRRLPIGCLLVVLAAGATPALAQDSAATRLAPVSVTVNRDAARSTLELPFGVSRLVIDSARTGIRRASLTEMLLGVPGLVVSNRFNPTQDPRLAIRGFGARSAFGIRGVRVVRDGIPITLADGQTAVDFVDLETVGAAEVMRGNAGGLYGNASGGVVEMRSEPLPNAGMQGRVRVMDNADALRLSAHAAGALASGVGGPAWQGTLTRTTSDGPRDYSRFRSTTASGDVQWQGRAGTLRAQLLWYDAPLAENPGAITASEVAHAPSVADSQNIVKRASKTVSQKLGTLSADRQWRGGAISASVFGGLRELGNPQAFAIIALDRKTLGATARLQQEGSAGGHPVRGSLGIDAQSQQDDRRNFNNCAGLTGASRPASLCPTSADRGVVTLDQYEKVGSAGLFARGEMTMAAPLNLTASVRGDQTSFSVRDRRVTSVPGGTIESLTMSAVSPMAGITWRMTPLTTLFANVATSFETPTTTELANKPDGRAGLNHDLRPQRGRTVEVGTKGMLGTHLLYDLSVFDISTRDELIPFEIPGGGGRRYFRNAGRTLRRGAELGVTAALGVVDVGGALSRLVYTYEDFKVGTTVLDGKRVPGVAPVTASGFATARWHGAYATVEAQQSSRTPADDANANYAAGYVLWNARAGLGRRMHGAAGVSAGIEPVVGVENLFDRTWVANVVTNATRGRFYETGAGRRVYVGLTMAMGK